MKEEELDKDSGRDMTPRLIKDLGMKKKEGNLRSYRYGLYECQYCGKEWETTVKSVKCGDTKSCGCVNLRITHGLRTNKFYQTWYNMVHRCVSPKNKDYKDYGARGITVCEEWLDVANFVAWAEETHPHTEGYTLDRIDNDKGYSPENCTWSDKTTQCINQRVRKDNKSGVVGVDFKPKENKYVARITVLGNKVYIGTFLTKEEAILARDNYIIENKLPYKLSTDYVKES